MAVGELHHPHGLPVPLGIRHPEVPVRALADVPPLLVSNEHDRAPVEAGKARDDRRIVGERAVSVQLDEVVADPLHVVERVGTILMACELDRVPDLVLTRLGGNAFELALQPGHLARDADAAQERKLAELGQPLLELQLLHLARGGSAGPMRLDEHGEETTDERAKLGSRDNGVDVAEAGIRLGQAEVVGKFLARRLLDDARPREREQSARLGDDQRRPGWRSSPGRLRSSGASSRK